MREGRIVGECAAGASEEAVMALAVGHGGNGQASTPAVLRAAS
jgi:hypothetical protein